jgi:DNA mismatch endonuclease (patch repair protein)
MSLVRNKDTKPEIFVRSLVHSLGFRYRLHSSSVVGRPDIVLRRLQKVIFVHGCFWHRHGKGCVLTRWPKSRLDFWKPKLESNRKRDRGNEKKLRDSGWDVLVIWECELHDTKRLRRRLARFLQTK